MKPRKHDFIVKHTTTIGYLYLKQLLELNTS